MGAWHIGMFLRACLLFMPIVEEGIHGMRQRGAYVSLYLPYTWSTR